MSDYRFLPEERPTFPGSPYIPSHPTARRFAYAGVAIVTGISATLGNALVTVNTTQIGGSLGIELDQATFLPAVYVAANATANLLLVKARIQFGVKSVTYGVVLLYMVAALVELFMPGFGSAIFTRASSGIAAGALTTFTLYNLLQAFPARLRPAALIFGVTIPQLGTPLARLIPIDVITLGGWSGLNLIEVATALMVLAVMTWLPLPTSDRGPAFEKLDFVSIALLMPGFYLLCTVLGLGRLLWWTDTPWLGTALAASIALIAAGLILEWHRSHPLLQLRWIGTVEIIRFALIAALVRVALAEQTYGAVGLLTAAGLNNDQLHVLFAIVFVAMILGATGALVLAKPTRLSLPIAVAALVIALGSWLDSQGNNLTRPEQLYLSQALIGFGSAMFLGPSLVYGFLNMIKRGPDHLVSLITVFSMSQNIGGLGGSALLGTMQVVATRAHAQEITNHLQASDPLVAARLSNGSAALMQIVNREASVLAFNDVFRSVAVFALLISLYLFFRYLQTVRRERREQHDRLATAPA